MSSQKLGIIADTHIPDRRRKLHPHVLSIFREAGVGQIVHAGDASVPSVLRQLEEVAPVVAVRGNRDWFPHPSLPLRRVLHVNGKRIGLTHGHGGFFPYVRDKLRYLIRGPRSFDYYMRRAIALLPQDVDAVVFGHNHAPMNRKVDGKVVFNPGSACCHVFPQRQGSVGLLEVHEDGIEGKIILLD